MASAAPSKLASIDNNVYANYKWVSAGQTPLMVSVSSYSSATSLQVGMPASLDFLDGILFHEDMCSIQVRHHAAEAVVQAHDKLLRRHVAASYTSGEGNASGGAAAAQHINLRDSEKRLPSCTNVPSGWPAHSCIAPMNSRYVAVDIFQDHSLG